VLPDHVDLHGATLIEPLSCVLRGYDVLRTALGASVLVYGAGTMGLLLLEVAKHTGPRSVHVVDPNTERATRAAALGCTGAAPSVAALDVGEKWDVVIDATGNAEAIQDGVGRVARGGTFLQFGVASPETRVSISPYAIYNHEITITGSMAVLHSFERAADLFAAGIVDWQAFVTSQRPLAEYADALASFGRGEGVKTQVLPAA
jgi:threonine dehydrogenase-like Zn-dependent dehydrogenase